MPFVFFFIIDFFLSALYGTFSIFLLGSFGTILLFMLRPEVDDKTTRLLIVIKIVSILSVLLTYYNCLVLYDHPYYIGGSDDLHSETDAIDFVKYGYKWPWDWPLFVKDKGFIWILAGLMKLTGIEGYHTLSFRILNEDFLIATSFICYRLSRYRFNLNGRQALIVLLVVALFPNSLYISSFVFRDTICSFLMLLVFALCDDFFRTKNYRSIICKSKIAILVLLGVDLFLSFWIRPEALFFEIAIIGFSVLRDNSVKGKNVVFILLAAIIVYYIFSSIGAFDTITETITAYNEFRQDETAYSRNAIFKLIFTLPLLPFGILLRIAYGILAPLPVQLIDLFKIFSEPIDYFMIIVSLGMIPYYYYMAYLFRGVKKMDKYSLTFICIFLGYVVSTFTFRHVLLFYPYLWMILINNYYISSKKERRKISSVSIMVLMLLPILYFITKII